MTTRDISFAIQGMRGACAKCAVTIERALTQLDGVVSARVNYATERASIAYDSTRVSTAAMADTVHREGFAVSLERVVLNVNGLFYAPSARLVERALSRLDGVVRVQADLRAECITLDAFSESVNLRGYELTLAALGLSVVEPLTPHAGREFGLRTVVLLGLALLTLLSAGAHAGWWVIGWLHSPIVVIAISVLVAYGVGWRFYHLAYDAYLRGEFDASVVIALIASLLLFGGMPLALISSATWLTGLGFVLSTLSTTAWFLVRAFSLWVLPRLRFSSTISKSTLTLPQTHLGVISNGSRR